MPVPLPAKVKAPAPLEIGVAIVNALGPAAMMICVAAAVPN